MAQRFSSRNDFANTKLVNFSFVNQLALFTIKTIRVVIIDFAIVGGWNFCESLGNWAQILLIHVGKVTSFECFLLIFLTILNVFCLVFVQLKLWISQYQLRRVNDFEIESLPFLYHKFQTKRHEIPSSAFLRCISLCMQNDFILID